MNIKKYIIKNKRLIAIVTSSLIACLISIYMNEILDADPVYASLFYIPVILTGFWYYRYTIHLAIIFTLYINLLDIISKDGISIDQIFRGLSMILGATVLYCSRKILKKKNEELNISKNLLAHDKEVLRTMLLSIGDGVISADNNGNVTFLNEVAKKLTGWGDESAIGSPLGKVFNIINETTRKVSIESVKKVIVTGEVTTADDTNILITKDGIERSIDDNVSPIRDNEGNISGIILVFRDITNAKIKLNEIKYLSFHDSLTGLGNRRYLDENLKQLDNKENLPLSLIMGDVNGLKPTNDTFGHTKGDDLLEQVAQVLKLVCRNDDIICRYGGDEFVILLPKTNEIEVVKIVKRIRNAFSNIKIGPIDVSMSLGWSVKNNIDEDITDKLKAAENYMYENKIFESPNIRGNINNMDNLK